MIGPDKEPEYKLNWVYQEYEGGMVFLLTPKEGIIEMPLVKKNDIYEGLEIAVPTLFGFVRAHVVNKDDNLYWETDTSYGTLEFSIDDRKCWTTAFSFKKGIKKLHLITDEGKRKLPVIK